MFNIKVFAKHEAKIEEMSEYFSPNNVCKKNFNDCKKQPEYKFYQKMYDLYYLYLIKYNVKLDLPLIMSTLTFSSDDTYTVFQMNLSDYERQIIVEADWNPSEVTSLDWDYDYESKDNYLVNNDSSFDMQVLAKNMVSKITDEKCVKDGNTIKSKKVKDTEDDLKCDDGENLEKGNSTYELDLDKYDDFLLEYIEKKYYLNRVTANPVRSSGPSYISSKTPSIINKKKSSSNDSGNNTEQGGNNNEHVVSASGNVTIDKLNKIALGEEGNGGSKYWTAYGSGPNEWCAMFISWLFDQVGGEKKYLVKDSFAGEIPRKSIPAGLGTWLEDECTDSSTVPRAGDVILFTPTIYPTDKYTSRHVGYVYKVDDNKVYTVEGNSGTWDCTTSYVTVNEYDRKSCTINGYYRPNY